MTIEKILLLNAAATLAAAVVENAPDNLPVDPEIKDQALRAENLMGWEETRIFYRAMISALDDDVNWPAPKLAAGSLVGALGGLVPGLTADPKVQAVLAAVGQVVPQLGAVLGALKAAMPPPAAPPAGSLPDPGAPAAAAS